MRNVTWLSASRGALIIAALLSRVFESFAEGVQSLVPALLSKHMPGRDDHGDGPFDELACGQDGDAGEVGELLSKHSVLTLACAFDA